MEDDITVGVQLLLDDGVSDALAAIMQQLAAADQAIAATSANWEGLDTSDGVPLSPSPIPSDADTTKPLQPTVLDFDAPNPSGSPGDQQEFIAPIAEVTAPAPLAPVDDAAHHADATPASYAPMPPEISAPDETWPVAAPIPDGSDIDLAPLLTALPSAPVDSGYAPSAAVAAATTLPTVSAAPIPSDDRSTAAPPSAHPSDPSWQTQPSTPFAPMLPRLADSVAPREIEPTAAAPSASDLAPSGGSGSDAMATAPLAEAGGGEGQLMLDGNLLGRWVIDHLSREADRPPAGGTAFDPRQGR